MQVALYARVSTDGQTVQNQLQDLEAVAKREGWEVVERFMLLGRFWKDTAGYT